MYWSNYPAVANMQVRFLTRITNQSHNTRQSASANGPAWAALRKHRMISSDTKSALCGPRREWRSVATTQNLQVNLTKRLTHVTGAG